MSEHTEQTTSQPSAVPAPIQLEDFIEAVTRGVTRALAAQDEVSGYATAQTRPPAWGGIIVGNPLPFPFPFPFEDSGGTSGGGIVRGVR